MVRRLRDPAYWFPLSAGDISHNLGPTICSKLIFITLVLSRFLDTKDERHLSENECDSVLSSILDEFVHPGDGSYRDLIYQHEWRPGDFIISDNLALGHKAAPETQLPPSKVGLRVMHRVTVAGKMAPKK